MNSPAKIAKSQTKAAFATENADLGEGHSCFHAVTKFILPSTGWYLSRDCDITIENFVFFLNKSYLLIFMSIGILPRVSGPWNLSYKQSWVVMWMLGTGLRYSGRTVSALKGWAISPVTRVPFLTLCCYVYRCLPACVCARRPAEARRRHQRL